MNKTIDDINLHQWFIDRELNFVPDHFVKSNTPINIESKAWILEKLRGRFAFSGTNVSFLDNVYPYFEDPKEAVFYELTFG